MSSSQFKTVTIAGGTGSLGYFITDAFLNDGSYKVKILRRKPAKESEKANLFASRGAEIVYADYNQKDDLVKALKGTDVFVSAVSYDPASAATGSENLYDIQLPLLNAAKEASVKRFIPSEFDGEYELGSHPYTDDKVQFHEELVKSGLEYTCIKTGIFQEYLGWFGFDAKNKKAKFFGDGNSKISSTSMSDIGKYTVESLKLPEARNATIFVCGATLTLNEYLQKFEEASGSKWEVVVDKEVQHRYKNNIEPVPSFMDEFIAFFTNVVGYLRKVDNDKFSFAPQPIDEVISNIVKEA